MLNIVTALREHSLFSFSYAFTPSPSRRRMLTQSPLALLYLHLDLPEKENEEQEERTRSSNKKEQEFASVFAYTTMTTCIRILLIFILRCVSLVFACVRDRLLECMRVPLNRLS